MTDRDRLIELLNEAEDICDRTLDCDECKYHQSAMCDDELKIDYLLANGVIVPPCKVGDKVYVIKYCRCGNPEAYEMKHCHKKDTKKTPKVYGSVMLRQDGKRLRQDSYRFEKPQWERKPIGTIRYKIIQKPFKLEWLTEIGKTVFLTKKEAEQALKNRGKEDEGK